MKEREIIKYMTGDIQDKMPDIEKVRENCLNQKTNKISNKTNKLRFILVKPAAIIALMICFVMLASATAVIIYQTQYIPGKGFVEGDYEVYYTPEILKFKNQATVETITRVKNGKSSELSIIITDTLDKNIKIITPKNGEFELIPTVDYNYSSFGTLGKYQFNNEGGYSSYGYCIKDFPDINEFILVNNGEEIDINLVKSNSDDVLTADDSGITMKFYNMSKGSKVIAYEMKENNYDIWKLFSGSSGFLGGNIELGAWAFKLYNGNGNEIKYNGYDYSGAPNGLGVTMFLRIESEKSISKMEINNVMVTIDMYNNDNGVDIPVPKDGEEIVLNDKLLLYDYNGLTSELTSVTRKGNEITIYTKTEYNGEDIENIDSIDNIYMWFRGELGGKMDGPGFQSLTINGDEEFIYIRPSAVRFSINGNWEINFD